MGQLLHGCATTTETIRRAIQHSQESLRALAKRYGINPKSVAKWRQRSSVADLPTGPKEPKSTVLSIEDEAIIVVFRRHTLLPEIRQLALGSRLISVFPLPKVESAGREARGRAQLTALKENLEGSREDSPPALQARQLLRIFCEFSEKNGDSAKRLRGRNRSRV